MRRLETLGILPLATLLIAQLGCRAEPVRDELAIAPPATVDAATSPDDREATPATSQPRGPATPPSTAETTLEEEAVRTGTAQEAPPVVESRPSRRSAPRDGGPFHEPNARAAATLGAHLQAKAGKRKTGNWAVAATPSIGAEDYAHLAENDFVAVADDPRSTFSIDVDTASYSNVRRFLRDGTLPPVDAVRIEEMINYFDYDYEAPVGSDPFSLTSEVGPCPWNDEHLLVHVGLQGKIVDQSEVPPRNLVFLLDVSGSMNAPDKLPLLQRALGLVVDNLRPEDTVSIVVYAGASGLVLPPTPGSDRGEILAALERLSAGGSTNGGAGIELAYAMAQKSFREGGINRVILATDGDFNVGTISQSALLRMIEEKRESGVFLSVLGFGTGNLKDSTMEMLANKGNGNYAYIDSIAEARKVLVEQAGGTLVTIAKDVKLQVEFNPTQVAAYRLIGYENRKLAHTDFNDDTKDAGEIGAGHSVTALYEIVPATGKPLESGVDPLAYQEHSLTPAAASGELMKLKIRYKRPNGSTSKLSTFAIVSDDPSLAKTSNDFRFAAAVAELGLLLRGSAHRGKASWDQVIELAGGALGDDPHGRRAELVELTKIGRDLSGTSTARRG